MFQAADFHSIATGYWRYETRDTVADVTSDGYFSAAPDLVAGGRIDVAAASGRAALTGRVVTTAAGPLKVVLRVEAVG